MMLMLQPEVHTCARADPFAFLGLAETCRLSLLVVSSRRAAKQTMTQARRTLEQQAVWRGQTADESALE